MKWATGFCRDETVSVVQAYLHVMIFPLSSAIMCSCDFKSFHNPPAHEAVAQNPQLRGVVSWFLNNRFVWSTISILSKITPRLYLYAVNLGRHCVCPRLIYIPPSAEKSKKSILFLLCNNLSRWGRELKVATLWLKQIKSHRKKYYLHRKCLIWELPLQIGSALLFNY